MRSRVSQLVRSAEKEGKRAGELLLRRSLWRSRMKTNWVWEEALVWNWPIESGWVGSVKSRSRRYSSW